MTSEVSQILHFVLNGQQSLVWCPEEMHMVRASNVWIVTTRSLILDWPRLHTVTKLALKSLGRSALIFRQWIENSVSFNYSSHLILTLRVYAAGSG